jgi:deoxyribodipyrimidine photo-lyase
MMKPDHGVPAVRQRWLRPGEVRASGDVVLYWMTAARRLNDNFALQYAAGEADRLARPLLILEALRVDYPWASARFHRFALDGMALHARILAGRAGHYAYVEPARGAGRGLLEALAARSCLVVADEFPGFFLPRMLETAAARITAPLVAIDSNGLLPLRATDTAYPSAYAFRRFLQKALPAQLEQVPDEDPLRARRLPPPAELPREVLERWPSLTPALLEGAAVVARLPIDQAVMAVPLPGGAQAAATALLRFLEQRLPHYAQARNDPDAEATSGLSPWLHWGQLSAHRVLRELALQEDWAGVPAGARADGRKEGWWGMSVAAEAFLDELVTWRELGYNATAHLAGYDRWESLPQWARATLTDHEADPRPATYSLEQFENALTHDPLWNAAQRQLRAEGRIHSYLRMLWGKKILEWTRAPRDALDIMIQLNNRWSLDGRDPNSYSGIFWCLGRYDRPWPERPVFGKVRSMSSDATRRKVHVSGYLQRWAG